MNKDIYVVVAENNKETVFKNRVFKDDGGPLVFEQYTRHADIESIRKRAKALSSQYGKCIIAKLEFVDGEVYE